MFALHSFYVNENRVKCSASDLFYLYMTHQQSEICCLNDIETEGPISARLETALPRSCSKRGAIVIVWEHITFSDFFHTVERH